jgi:hypothetical protein
MTEILVIEIRKEIVLLESWILTTQSGGWSSHLIEPMKKRVTELKSILYTIGDKAFCKKRL